MDVLILDRGIFDALCWFQWLVCNKKMEKEQKEITENFLLMEELVKCIDIVFAFCVLPNISIEREYATLLTDKLGSIMNQKVLGEYLEAIEDTITNKRSFFHRVFKIETSYKNQDEVGKEVTTITLETLKDLLMERIGYFEKTEILNNILLSQQVFSDEKLTDVLSTIKFDLRNVVEENSNYIQPIPIAVITNIEKDKVLVIKKNKSAVSMDSPERDKILLYIGGHSRYEDSTEVTSHDFISICKSTLKREIKEEIGISIALNGIRPFYIYTPSSERSKKHLAVCFVISFDEEGIKLNLDPHELMLNKGKSKSGRFLTIDEICKEPELEQWSEMILKQCFNTEHKSNRQLSIFDN